MVMQLLLRRKADTLPEEDWQDFLNLQAHILDIKNDTTRDGKGSNKWQDVELMGQAATEYSEAADSLELVQSMIARVGGSMLILLERPLRLYLLNGHCF